jgi:hypothetical protein
MIPKNNEQQPLMNTTTLHQRQTTPTNIAPNLSGHLQENTFREWSGGQTKNVP